VPPIRAVLFPDDDFWIVGMNLGIPGVEKRDVPLMIAELLHVGRDVPSIRQIAIGRHEQRLRVGGIIAQNLIRHKDG